MLNRRYQWLWGLLIWGCCHLETTAQEQDQEVAVKRPNVVLIITDDQGYGDVGFHGNEMIQTPHLDDLARQSFRLTNFHVDPTCAETRSALMSGQYSCRVGVWHTIMGRSLLDPRAQTMANVFQSNGYRTGMFGKWHLGDQFPLRPQDRGFEEVLAHGGGGVGQTPDYWANDYFDDSYFANGQAQKQFGYCTDVFFAGAKQFIENAGDRPFFCYLSTNAPHGPYLVDPKYAKPYLDQGVPQPMANFYGMITNIDENIGRLRQFLEAKGIADNTILIFMTDNGTAAGVARGKEKGWRGFNAGMRGQKGSQYDGGHRVPCFVSWPQGGIGAGESNQLAAHFDLFPTLVELCTLEADATVHWDGTSVASTLQGKDLPSNRVLVVHSQRMEQPKKWNKTAVMQGQWRLVDGHALYNLENDPGQVNDLSADQPERMQALSTFYDQWWQDSSQNFDEYVRLVVGSPVANPTTLNAHDWHAPQPQVPWNQGMIRRDHAGSGFWAISVAEFGAYRLTFRMRPEQENYEFAEGAIKIEIGGETFEAELPVGESSVTIETELFEGPTTLQTWVTENEKPVRGAYYVTLEKLD
jgi:arylsulfatase A-like enzyme